MLPLRVPEVDAALLSRIEDAGLNASAPPQQQWLDGWLLRCSPGKAKRARCINALTTGLQTIDEKLAQCSAVFRNAGLPLLVRITPFTQPTDLDAQLAARGFSRIDDTRVMALRSLAALTQADVPPLPDGWRLDAATAHDYAHTIGTLRGSTPGERAAHAQRLAGSALPCHGFVLQGPDGSVAACALYVREGDLVGLYDVFTTPARRSGGLATALCRRLLVMAQEQGARIAYLQVDADNHAARAVYQRLGFTDGYAYHYRTAAPGF